MTGVLTIAWLHYLAMMFLAAALIAEHLMFSPRPDPAVARKIVVVVMAAIWLYPAIKLIGWRRALRAGQAPTMSDIESRRVFMAIRIQLLILVFLPLLAAMMARGVGS